MSSPPLINGDLKTRLIAHATHKGNAHCALVLVRRAEEDEEVDLGVV